MHYKYLHYAAQLPLYQLEHIWKPWRSDYDTVFDNLEKIDFVCGEWVQNLTADGQISSNSFNINPQYELSITGESV